MSGDLWRRGQHGWPERFPLVQVPNAPLLVALAIDVKDRTDSGPWVSALLIAAIVASDGLEGNDVVAFSVLGFFGVLMWSAMVRPQVQLGATAVTQPVRYRPRQACSCR